MIRPCTTCGRATTTLPLEDGTVECDECWVLDGIEWPRYLGLHPDAAARLRELQRERGALARPS